MPLSEPEGYNSGHFARVFQDIFVPACEKAGYRAVRGSDVRATNLIHLDILQKLLHAPMALVDLSSRNPNVLFELGLRQAFDKPVVLVQEVGTPRIFDIAPLRYTEYRSSRIYDEVLADQVEVSRALQATRDASMKGSGINSIVKILALTQPASLPEISDANRDPVLQLIRAELSELRIELRRVPIRQAAAVSMVPEIARVALRALRRDIEKLEGPSEQVVGIAETEVSGHREREILLTLHLAKAMRITSMLTEVERAEAEALHIRAMRLAEAMGIYVATAADLPKHVGTDMV